MERAFSPTNCPTSLQVPPTELSSLPAANHPLQRRVNKYNNSSALASLNSNIIRLTNSTGDAEAYLGFANVVTDSSGNVGTSTFTFKKRTVEYAPYVTATVTAVGGDTGQFASKVLQQITLCQEEERVYAHYLEYRRSVVTDRTFRINRSHRLKELDDLAFDSCDDIINKIDVDDRANDTINNLHAYSSCDYADVFNVTHADYEEFGLANATGTHNPPPTTKKLTNKNICPKFTDTPAQ